MRCPNCLYNNHEQAEVCERCGEPLYGENRLFNTCRHCGYINEAGAEFCESCGEPMGDSGLRKSDRKKYIKKQQKRARKARTARSSSGGSSWILLLFLIFIALLLLGAIRPVHIFTPADVGEAETLLVLRGTTDLELSRADDLSEFGALAIDATGIVRMALYADGILVSAQNYDAPTQALFQPALSALAPGEHDIFIRSVNGNGQAAYSQLISVAIDAGATGSFALAADPNGAPRPEGVRANSVEGGQRISVSWDAAEWDFEALRVYARPPGSSGLVHLADIDSDSIQYDFPANRMGEWEVYVAYVSNEGYEGELGFARLTLGDTAEAGKQQTSVELPAPTKVRLAVNVSDCQQAASQLGGARDVFYSACIADVDGAEHHFLIWDWPLKWQEGKIITEADIDGFELKLVLFDAGGTMLGEEISTIPFSEIRGALRNRQPVDCGYRRSWYLRAVGPDSASDWVYAGSILTSSCDPEAPATDGCVGQADSVALSRLPDGFMPDLFFAKACEGLDLCYAEGRVGQPKVGCDNLYHSNLLAICNQNSDEWDLETCEKLANAYYKAANLYGAEYYPQEPSFTNCLEADHVAGCFRGNLPEWAQRGGDQTKSGTRWIGKATWTGVNRFIEAVLRVVDWGVAAVGSILPD